MNVVVTMAGQSERFAREGYSLPKFLLPVRGQTIIEHVVQMFDDSDHFFLAISRSQAEAIPTLRDFLVSTAPNVTVVIVDDHGRGPVHTALQVEVADANDPVIITYCDFMVEWDYPRFQREALGFTMAIPAFRGFHPASFGDTFYAYMDVKSDGTLRTLREKQSFTDRRHEEFASAGIYYFESFLRFRELAEDARRSHDFVNGEEYVSLLANHAINKGGSVLVTEVTKFICWGTPSDYEDYRYWEGIFGEDGTADKPAEESCHFSKTRQINIIAMAGRGSRFREDHYRLSKPLIPIGNIPMVVQACRGLPSADEWRIAALETDLERWSFIRLISQSVEGNVVPVSISAITEGQAITTLKALEGVAPNDSVFVASSDYITRFDEAEWAKIINDETIAGAVWVYRGRKSVYVNPEAFAYCQTDPASGELVRIVEKKTISSTPWRDPMVTGTFWLRRASDLVHAIEESVRREQRVNGEFYVGTALNVLLEDGIRLVLFEVSEWISLNSPQDVHEYLYWEEHFQQARS